MALVEIVYKAPSVNDSEKWDVHVTHPLQSWAWGEFRKLRQPIDRLGIYESDRLVNGYLIVWTKIPGTSFYFGYVPMASIPTQEDIDHLIEIGRTRNAVGIRMEPHELISEQNKLSSLQLSNGRNLFKPKTYWWDLTLSEEQLLSHMHQKARYNTRVAEKHGVVVYENNSSEAFAAYCDLLFGGTAKRQKVGMHSVDYQTQMWDTLHKQKMARLFVAEYQKKILSAMLVFTWKDAVYYAYGANSLEHKEVMAATALLWRVALQMKKEGYKLFDLWGAEEGTGFSKFKEQFGARLVELVGTYDVVVNPLGYRLFRFAEDIRWKIRHR